MRRDVFIENDSGGFSVLAADAVDAIIEDGRADDMRFVASHKAMLLELYGDDSMPVRIVVDEPLRPDEEAEWLALASWRIDTSDGRMLVMGGFDPDVLSWWRDGPDESGDGRGIGAFAAAPGSWRVDVYAHVGSMNGRAILDEADDRPGAAFRRDHAGRAFPLWLAKMLEFSGDDDPGFASLWSNVRGSMESGDLDIAIDDGDAIGYVVHVTRGAGPDGDPPEAGWFERDTGRRLPARFPLGLRSEVPDPELRRFRDDLLGIVAPEPVRPVADHVVEIIQVWSGDPLKRIDDGPVPLPLRELFLLHWLACLTADSPPRFELWIEPKGTWTPPDATPDFAVASKGGGITAIGPVASTGGWHVWWTSRDVVAALDVPPDGSTIDFAMAPRLDSGEERDPAIGRALYSGTIEGGTVRITEASPPIARTVLEDALRFGRDLLEGRIQLRSRAERAALEGGIEFAFLEDGTLAWDGDTAMLGEADERTVIMLAEPVFRVRFAEAWPMDEAQEDD